MERIEEGQEFFEKLDIDPYEWRDSILLLASNVVKNEAAKREKRAALEKLLKAFEVFRGDFVPDGEDEKHLKQIESALDELKWLAAEDPVRGEIRAPLKTRAQSQYDNFQDKRNHASMAAYYIKVRLDERLITFEKNGAWIWYYLGYTDEHPNPKESTNRLDRAIDAFRKAVEQGTKTAQWT